MLELATIESYYNESTRVYKRNILREYLQYKILEILFNSKSANHLSFIGGTCLRIVHNINRFSEDLDFDNLAVEKEEFIELSDEIKKSLEMEGYTVEMKSVFKGAFRTHFRFLNLLFQEGLSPHKEERLMIQVDADPQRYDYKPQTFILNKFDVFSYIHVTPVNILLAMKFFALLNRNRPMARDIYDIIFLSGKTEPDYEYLREKMDIEDKAMLKERLREKLPGLNPKEMSKEIEPFLIYKKEIAKVELFSEFIKSF
jgi:predicted nucleotidyltransferase component of viral defense system